MAAPSSYFAGASYTERSSPIATDLDESDIHDSANSAARSSRKRVELRASLPVNVPDWSNILKQDYYNNRENKVVDYIDDDGEGGDDRIPPHEVLARRRRMMTSFSMYEGIGRTLKGMDLSRVRNAIWEKTGFLD